MKRFVRSKKSLALLATVVVAAAAAIGAYAYLSAGGTGSGIGTAGTAANNLVVQGPCTGTNDTQASCAADQSVQIDPGLLPGGSKAVSYSIYNPNAYSVSVASVTGETAQSDSACQALNSDFSYADGAGNGLPITIPPGGVSPNLGGSLSESDDAANDQTSCTDPNATTLTLTAHGG